MHGLFVHGRWVPIPVVHVEDRLLILDRHVPGERRRLKLGCVLLLQFQVAFLHFFLVVLAILLFLEGLLVFRALSGIFFVLNFDQALRCGSSIILDMAGTLPLIIDIQRLFDGVIPAVYTVVDLVEV
jgi:hypothetical protein